jgi:large subunit ribosomal protein L10
MVAPKPSGFANTKAGKTAILERTKALVDQSALIISFPNKGVTKEAVDILRKELPKGIKSSVVKNSLMKKAVEGTQFDKISENLKNENMFLFIPEGQAKPTYDAYRKWQKEMKRVDPEFDLKSAAMENNVYVGKAIEAVVNLPTKADVITKIALGIKAIPTKVALGVKAVPSKLGRAFGALKTKLEDEAKEA